MSWFYWALLSAFFAGLTAVLAKAGTANIDSNLATAVRTSVVLVFALGIAFALNKQPLGSIPQSGWLWLTASGLATGASWLCYFKALKLGQASQVDPVDKLSVLVAMVFAFAFLGETLPWTRWLGGALILGGTVLVTWK